ncbi:MAG TPA: hypothetical protein VFB12_28605 [Ktedonobacteraceae bacterium]|nr:hypothetical protein [Ktedonobacteraceae bacterium]
MGQIRLSAKRFGPRWTALRIFAGLLKVLAWLVAVVGLLAAIGIIVSAAAGVHIAVGMLPPGTPLGGPLVSGIFTFLALLGAAFYFLVLYAASELILLLIAIEYNTRDA